MDISIEFSTASVSGKIPAEFIDTQNPNIFVGARRWEPKDHNYLRCVTYTSNWQGVGSDRIDADGNFEIKNLKPGKYYLALSQGCGSQIVSEIFELGDSEKLDGIDFTVPTAKLRVTVVDEFEKPISGASSILYNRDLELSYYGWLEEYQRAGNLYTDANGLIEYINLPQGNYILTSAKKGYLAETADIKVENSETVEKQIILDESAVVQFELAEDVNEAITRPMVYMYFKATDIKSGEVFAVPSYFGQIDEMLVYLKRLPSNPEGYEPDPYIDLPEGKYRIDYEVCQEELGNYECKQPLASGQVEVNAEAGQTTRVIIRAN